MQVNVFIQRKDTEAQNAHLVLPVSPEASPPAGLAKGWVHLVTTDTENTMFRSVKVEEEISARGYCIFTP